jgi:polyvinyl alcohol dehydrogenase (cytochrome)
MSKLARPAQSTFSAARILAALLAACGLMTLAPQIVSAQTAQAPVPPAAAGEAIYQSHCAMCHDHPDATRAPSRDNLAVMRPQAIQFALTEGKMKAQGANLSDETRGQLIQYLTGKSVTAADNAKDNAWAEKMMCPADRRTADLKGPPTVSGFGYDRHNTRNLTAREAGLTKAQLSNMELAWAIAVPDAATMRSQPAVVGKTVFWPVADAGAMYAFDVSQPMKPCITWVYKTAGPLRTSAAYGEIADGRGVLAFGGFDTTLYVVDARTGQLIWKKKVGTYSYSLTTGTPVVLKSRLIVPVSQYEIMVAAPNGQTCCTNHGYVLSLDPATGAQQWRYDTMPEATPVKDRGDGKMLYGPSGAPIWDSPAVDEKNGLIYIGTGESNSLPVSRNTDAMIAIGLNDGKQRWSHQGTDKDIFLSGCGPHPKPTQLNCAADTVYRDVDFGASMVLAHPAGGPAMMFAGQKSGAVWGMNPATGEKIWRNPLGTGSPLGGVHWGLAYDRGMVYAPVSLAGHNLPDETVDTATIKSGLYALDARTGAIKWLYATTPDCTPERMKRLPSCQRYSGLSTAPSVIDGAVVEGGLDGYLYVIDGATGALLWKYDTTMPVQGINGVEGKGGSIDAASITAANGLLLVNSGYGMFGETPGNVILAFRAKGR